MNYSLIKRLQEIVLEEDTKEIRSPVTMRLLARLEDDSNGIAVYDMEGKLLFRYNKNEDRTIRANGEFVAQGNALNILISNYALNKY